jgi:hypothetical protein
MGLAKTDTRHSGHSLSNRSKDESIISVHSHSVRVRGRKTKEKRLTQDVQVISLLL